jgi:Tol biopolymer transport system component
MTPQSQIAHYRIAGKLGEGGMGAVYRATDTKLNREVAVKVLPDSFAVDPDRLARFSREAQVLASLNHPNIAAIYGVEERALILELVEGPTLAERIAAGPIAIEDALPIVRQIAEALEYAHDRGIVHRDLKPANVKVTPEGRVKVLDFGLAKALAAEAAAGDPMSSPTITMRATMAGLIMGTAGYMSPEQAKGKPVDRRADIWAFGVVLFEMLTGRMMYTGETVSETLASVIKDAVDLSGLPADTPPAVRRMLKRCLEKDPQRRLQAIGEARIAIEDAAVEEPAPVAAPVAVAQVRRGAPWWAIGVAAAIPLIVLGGMLWLATRPVERPMQRFNADLGPDAVAGPRITIAISRDGKRIVHQVQSPTGTMLATRLLDQSLATPLTGTANMGDPFFSPDGQWIGFFGPGRLMKVSVNGGAPIPLCEASSARGAVWGEDGFIYAVLDGISVWRVPEGGGKAELITDPSKNGRRNDRWPQVLPGGESLLVTSSNSAGNYEEANISVLSLKTKQHKVIHRGGYFGRYLPSGHLVFVHSGTLFAVRFDLQRLETRGTPAPIIDDVAALPGQGAGQFDFSTNGIFTYSSGKSASDAGEVAWMDKSGHIEKVFNVASGRTPRLSPDGKRLALSINGDVYVYDLARSTTTRLTTESHNNSNYPQWMPDGQHIIFGAGNGLNWIRADGSGKPELLLASTNPIAQSISPDGKTVAFHLGGQGGGRDLYTASLDASDPDHPKLGKPEPFVITPQADVDPAFSPDGKWLAYTSGQSSGGYQTYVRPFPAGAKGGQVQISSESGRFPLWSRTSKEIFYVNERGKILVVPYTIAGGVFTPGKAEVWCETPILMTGVAIPLDLAADGKRFIVFPGSETGHASQKVNLHAVFLLNFFDELKRRVP